MQTEEKKRLSAAPTETHRAIERRTEVSAPALRVSAGTKLHPPRRIQRLAALRRRSSVINEGVVCSGGGGWLERGLMQVRGDGLDAAVTPPPRSCVWAGSEEEVFLVTDSTRKAGRTSSSVSGTARM